MNVPRLKKHRFIEPWQTLKKGDVRLSANEYECVDGRRHVYFWQSGEDIRGREFSRNVTRIGYRSWPEGAQFLGMSVQENLRGIGLSSDLLRYFMRSTEVREKPLKGTGIINKPVIALALKKAGFEPASEDFIVEILPKSSYDTDPEIPKVAVVHQTPDCSDIVGGSQGGRFYDIVPPEDVLTSYPINGTEMTVALNTRYHPVSV